MFYHADNTAGSSSQLSNKTEQASRAQQGMHARPPASAGGSSSCSTDAGRPLTMLRSPAAMLPSRHLPQNTASSRQVRGLHPLQVLCAVLASTSWQLFAVSRSLVSCAGFIFEAAKHPSFALVYAWHQCLLLPYLVALNGICMMSAHCKCSRCVLNRR